MQDIVRITIPAIFEQLKNEILYQVNSLKPECYKLNKNWLQIYQVNEWEFIPE